MKTKVPRTNDFSIKLNSIKRQRRMKREEEVVEMKVKKKFKAKRESDRYYDRIEH